MVYIGSQFGTLCLDRIVVTRIGDTAMESASACDRHVHYMYPMKLPVKSSKDCSDCSPKFSYWMRNLVTFFTGKRKVKVSQVTCTCEDSSHGPIYLTAGRVKAEVLMTY